MTEIINLTQKNYGNHLHRFGYVFQHHIWMSHDLSEKNLTNASPSAIYCLNEMKIFHF